MLLGVQSVGFMLELKRKRLLNKDLSSSLIELMFLILYLVRDVLSCLEE